MKTLAHYDRIRDIIVGCEPNTLKWYHEKGHQIITKSGYLPVLEVVILMWGLMVLAFLVNQEFWVAKQCLYLFIMSMMMEEIICWGYAFRRKLSSL